MPYDQVNTTHRDQCFNTPCPGGEQQIQHPNGSCSWCPWYTKSHQKHSFIEYMGRKQREKFKFECRDDFEMDRCGVN